jgi:hypothetical protein
MLLHDAVADAQTETGSLFLGREERIKDSRKGQGRNSRASVAHLDLHHRLIDDDSTVFDSEAQTRRELAEVRRPMTVSVFSLGIDGRR